jgi:cyanophycinase
MTDEVWAKFIELAGGEDSKIVVIPTASASADEDDPALTVAQWNERGAAKVDVLHTRSREVAQSAEFVAPLTSATGVWFGGGSQSRITEVYLGTAVDEALRNVLRRGGVIGGSSAGAAIMTGVMIAGGNPVARVERGFGFLPGAVVDQHFLRRSRVNRLLGVLENHSGLVGFGIDEGTALVVTGTEVLVVGRSYVMVLVPQAQGPVRIEMLEDGEKGDLLELSREAARQTTK